MASSSMISSGVPLAKNACVTRPKIKVNLYISLKNRKNGKSSAAKVSHNLQAHVKNRIKERSLYYAAKEQYYRNKGKKYDKLRQSVEGGESHILKEYYHSRNRVKRCSRKHKKHNYEKCYVCKSLVQRYLVLGKNANEIVDGINERANGIMHNSICGIEQDSKMDELTNGKIEENYSRTKHITPAAPVPNFSIAENTKNNDISKLSKNEALDGLYINNEKDIHSYNLSHMGNIVLSHDQKLGDTYIISDKNVIYALENGIEKKGINPLSVKCEKQSIEKQKCLGNDDGANIESNGISTKKHMYTIFTDLNISEMIDLMNRKPLDVTTVKEEQLELNNALDEIEQNIFSKNLCDQSFNSKDCIVNGKECVKLEKKRKLTKNVSNLVKLPEESDVDNESNCSYKSSGSSSRCFKRGKITLKNKSSSSYYNSDNNDKFTQVGNLKEQKEKNTGYSFKLSNQTTTLGSSTVSGKSISLEAHQKENFYYKYLEKEDFSEDESVSEEEIVSEDEIVNENEVTKELITSKAFESTDEEYLQNEQYNENDYDDKSELRYHYSDGKLFYESYKLKKDSNTKKFDDDRPEEGTPVKMTKSDKIKENHYYNANNFDDERPEEETPVKMTKSDKIKENPHSNTKKGHVNNLTQKERRELLEFYEGALPSTSYSNENFENPSKANDESSEEEPDYSNLFLGSFNINKKDDIEESSDIEPKNNKFTSSFFPSSFFNPDEPIIASKLFGLPNTENNNVDAYVKHKNPFEITKDNLNTKKINNNTVDKADKQTIKEVKNDSRKRKKNNIFDESSPESIKKFKYSNNYMNINNVIEKNDDQAAQHEEERRQKILKDTQRAKIYGYIIKKNCRLMSYGQNKDYNHVPKESNKKRVRFHDKVTIIPNLPPKNNHINIPDLINENNNMLRSFGQNKNINHVIERQCKQNIPIKYEIKCNPMKWDNMNNITNDNATNRYMNSINNTCPNREIYAPIHETHQNIKINENNNLNPSNSRKRGLNEKYTPPKKYTKKILNRNANKNAMTNPRTPEKSPNVSDSSENGQSYHNDILEKHNSCLISERTQRNLENQSHEFQKEKESERESINPNLTRKPIVEAPKAKEYNCKVLTEYWDWDNEETKEFWNWDKKDNLNFWKMDQESAKKFWMWDKERDETCENMSNNTIDLDDEELLNVIRDMIEVRKNLDPAKTAQILEKYTYTPPKSSIREVEIVYMPTPPYNKPSSPPSSPEQPPYLAPTLYYTPPPPKKKNKKKHTLDKDPQN
ncbi:conserved rodent malaria protein, unknown function [Plasmodium vinckei lentum]|uniref:Uncharacterized protein n=1 Tax=Plasmodium vinckei lentum TaxID=138297 RepID=A0A6V7T1K7_PLAVN|nr:conserved rodent malaria protein, unknown function [Plasmodium vinckei lentum]